MELLVGQLAGFDGVHAAKVNHGPKFGLVSVIFINFVPPGRIAPSQLNEGRYVHVSEDSAHDGTGNVSIEASKER
jgi:hypothetical protein